MPSISGISQTLGHPEIVAPAASEEAVFRGLPASLVVVTKKRDLEGTLEIEISDPSHLLRP
jgi:hypothetical protein